MVFLPLELINLIIEELYHLDRTSVASMCFVWPHATRFIQETVFRSIKIVADDDEGPGAHLGDLTAKPPHITRLVQDLTIQRSVDSTDENDPAALPVPPAEFFSNLPNLTSLSLSFLSFTAVEDLPSLFTALSRCPISSLKLFHCEFHLSEMNALFHHLCPRLKCLQLEGIFIDELFRYMVSTIHVDPAVVDFDNDGDVLQIEGREDRAYIHLDELCLYARTTTIDILMDLYTSRKFSPLARARKLVIKSDIWTPTFVERINRLVARATSDFSLEYLEIRSESFNEVDDILPPIEIRKLKTLELHLARSSDDDIEFLVWHTSTLLNLPPTIAELILTIYYFEEGPHSESWLNLDAALCQPKVELVPNLTIFTTMKESKLRALLPKAHAKFPRAFRCVLGETA